MSEISARPLDRRPEALADEQLVAALREGDERAFVALVGRYGPLMLRVASTYVRTPAVAEEVCDTLDVSEVNQRVLLHRARSKVRAALERYFDAELAVS